MQRKSPARKLFDEAIDKLKPFLPVDYGRRAVEAWEGEETMTADRLWQAVRKRGTEPDWPAYQALLAVKQPQPVERKPRKKHRPRSHRQSLATAA